MDAATWPTSHENRTAAVKIGGRHHVFDDPLGVQQRAGHFSFETTQSYIRDAENLRAGFGEVFPPLPACLERLQLAAPLRGQQRLELEAQLEDGLAASHVARVGRVGRVGRGEQWAEALGDGFGDRGDLLGFELHARGRSRVFAMPPHSALSQKLKAYLARAGVKRAERFVTDATRKAITFHDLRSTGITWMAVRGDPEP
jgi:hypothetical protein